MALTKTGRAIVIFPYKSKKTGKTYDSVLLGLERANGKYSLPGGQFDSRRDRDTLDTALRELHEEYGLTASRLDAKKVYDFTGYVCDHDIYLINASGRLKLDTNELKGIGFFNAGGHNQIPDHKLERHVKALTTEYFGTKHETKTPSGIIIPGHYFTGNADPRIVDWETQRKGFVRFPLNPPQTTQQQRRRRYN